MYPVPAENRGRSSSHVAASWAGFSIIERSQLSLAGAAMLARTRYFTTNANPKSAPRLGKSFGVSNSANRLFHNVQKKQNPTIQKGRPRSGISELKTCVEAANSDTSTAAFAAFFIGGKDSDNHPSIFKSPARKNSTSRIDANTRQISAGLTKTKAPSAPSSLSPPNSAAVRKIDGRKT